MSIASSASEDGWVPTVYDQVEKVKGTAENKRTVCCVVPYDASTRSVLMISSQKKPGMWTLPKGGKEEGEPYAEAALREAWEEGGILGYITSDCICQIDTERNHVYFYPLQVSEMKPEWPESGRSREWVSVEEAIARVYWRPEQAEALQHFSTWRDTLVESDTSNESSESGLPTSGADEWIPRPGRLLAQLGTSRHAPGPPAVSVGSRTFAVSAASWSTASGSLPGDDQQLEQTPATSLPDKSSSEPTASTSASLSAISSASAGLGDVRQPVRLFVSESTDEPRLGTRASDGGSFGVVAAERRSSREQKEARRLTNLSSLTAPSSTELGKVIAQGPQVWYRVLTEDILTIPQKVLFLADPQLHGSPIPTDCDTKWDAWYAFVRHLHSYLNPKNSVFALQDDVRSTLLQDGVTRILQHQSTNDPFLLLLLLDLCQETKAESSAKLFKMLADRVREAQADWWVDDGPEHLGLVQRPVAIVKLVDRIRLALSREDIADAWDQSVHPTPLLLHRRRLYTFLTRRKPYYRSAAGLGGHATKTVDYVLNFVTSSAVQHATDPVVLILVLKMYQSTSPSVRGEAFFRATLDLLPELCQTWTQEYKRSIREGIAVCNKADAEMYQAVRQWYRRDLSRYLGDQSDFWKGIFPTPREIGTGLLSRKDKGEAIESARTRGKSIYDPGEALDFVRQRALHSNAERFWSKGESSADESRVEEAARSFGMREG